MILPMMLALASVPAPSPDCRRNVSRGLASYFSDGDYPLSALRRGEEGRVEFCLRVNREGLVESCTITSSSGFADLDETTCRIARDRVRFTPAHDAGGSAVEDFARGAIRWALPRPAPMAVTPPK